MVMIKVRCKKCNERYEMESNDYDSNMRNKGKSIHGKTFLTDKFCDGEVCLAADKQDFELEPEVKEDNDDWQNATPPEFLSKEKPSGYGYNVPITLTGNKCKDCGHVWLNRTKNVPHFCPGCRSYTWTGVKEELEKEQTTSEPSGKDVQIIGNRCRKCKHVWIPRKETKVCPKCHTYKWR